MDNMESREYLNQAESLMAVNQYDDALECINKAIACDKMNEELYIFKGIIYANKFELEPALNEFENVLKINKKNGEAFFHIGNIYIMQDDITHGIENYNKAISYGYDDPQIYYNLAMMYEENEDYDLAIRNYSKVIIKDPLRTDARIRKASIYIATQKYQEALETLNELILTDPDLYDGYHIKATLLAEMGRGDEGLQVLDEAIQLFPEDPAFLIDRINIYVLQNEIDKAKEQISALEGNTILDNSQKRHIELEKARLFALDNDMPKVIESLELAQKYTKMDDENSIDHEATFLLTNCYLSIENYPKAIECSEQLIESEKYEYLIPSYYTLPVAYKRMGEVEKANAIFKDSISKLRAITLENPSIADGYLFRALCLKEIEEYDKALELSEYLLKIDGNSSVFHNLKAEILHSMGQEEAAASEKNIAASLK